MKQLTPLSAGSFIDAFRKDEAADSEGSIDRWIIARIFIAAFAFVGAMVISRRW